MTAHMRRYTVATSVMLTDVFGAGCGLLFVDWIGTCAWLVDVGVGLQEAKFNGDAYFVVSALLFWRMLALHMHRPAIGECAAIICWCDPAPGRQMYKVDSTDASERVVVARGDGFVCE